MICGKTLDIWRLLSFPLFLPLSALTLASFPAFAFVAIAACSDYFSFDATLELDAPPTLILSGGVGGGGGGGVGGNHTGGTLHFLTFRQICGEKGNNL